MADLFETAFDQFGSFHVQDRGRRLDKILRQLTHYEILQVQAYVNNYNFKTDIVSLLPVEIILSISQYLTLEEIIRFQNVSRRWKTVFSSNAVLYAALSAENPWLLKNNSQDYSSLIHKRLRVQNAIFPTKISFVPRHGGVNDRAERVAYAEGNFAWLDSASLVLSVLGIRTGEFIQFTTENRQILEKVRISGVLVAAVGGRVCHVWNLHSCDYSWFQLPNASCDGCFFIRGTKVLLLCGNHLIYLSSETRTAHSLLWENPENLRVLTLDENGDGFTIVYQPTVATSPDQCTEDREMYIEHFELENGVFRSTSKHIEVFSLTVPRVGGNRKYPIHRPHAHHALHVGQCSLNPEEICISEMGIAPKTPEVYDLLPLELPTLEPPSRQSSLASLEAYYLRLCSLENEKDIVFHSCIRYEKGSKSRLRFITPSPGIIYVSPCQFQGNLIETNEPFILHCSKPTTPESMRYYTESHILTDRMGYDLYGDGDFMIFVNGRSIEIQSFNDRSFWDPDTIEWPDELRRVGDDDDDDDDRD